MSSGSHYRPLRLRGLLGLVALVSAMAVLTAEPLHLLEGHGEALAPSRAQGELPLEEAPGSVAASSTSGGDPFSPDPHDCLSCLALSLTGPATDAVTLQAPALRAPHLLPASGPTVHESRGSSDARPRAPPSA